MYFTTIINWKPPQEIYNLSVWRSEVRMDFTWLKSRCRHSFVLSGNSREKSVSLPFPASRVHPYSIFKACNVICFSGQSSVIYCSSEHSWEISSLLKNLELDWAQANLPNSRFINLITSAKSFLWRQHIHRFWMLRSGHL